MNNKIAIMTWYTYKNYGTALQAAALYKKINELGLYPDIIQYTPRTGVSEPSMSALAKRAANKAKSIVNGTYMPPEKAELFDSFFKERITETRECKTYPELYMLNDEYNAFVCGSDQIWSPLNYDGNYYLEFVKNSAKAVAYAPSLGVSKIKDDDIKESIIRNVSRFEHLSVRENLGAKLIKEIAGIDAEVVLDPTLLMTGSEWDKYANVDKCPEIKEKEYMICYFLGDADKYMSYVRALSAKAKIPFYVIPVTKKQKNKNAVPFEVGPCEFVSLIKNAKYVCTDSFHGMAFAVNYNIPFSVFKRFNDKDPGSQNSRIFSLIEMLDLGSRLVDPGDKIDLKKISGFDFTEANKILEEKRALSRKYLKNSLEQAVSAETSMNGEAYKITDLCCGCGACQAVCPKNAITVAKNDEGFISYNIDETLCVRCGKCKTVCPFSDITAPSLKNAEAMFSVKSNSAEVLIHSSSGGIGHEIASNALNNNEAVCGCAYDNEHNIAKHIVINPDESEKLPLLQGSKYIQSHSDVALGEIYNMSKTQKITFFGTPCQAAAVDKLLRARGVRENSIIVDLICHGVPTSHLWDKYISDIDKKYGVGENPEITFRCKGADWHKRMIKISGNGKIYKNNERSDDFYAFFRRALCDNKTCYECPYREKSAADIRIGDYWGSRFIGDKQGVSMVIANTKAGYDVLNQLRNKKVCRFEEQNLNDYWAIQCPNNHRAPLFRKKLIEEFKNSDKSIHKLRKEYCGYYDTFEKLSDMFTKFKRLMKR